MHAITEFRGDYRWLSNFWLCNITLDGHVWPSSEHYYVAMKTQDLALQARIRKTPKPGDVKRLGATILLRPDWDQIKIGVMRRAVEAKFTQNSDLLQKLVATGEAELIEGNTWGDTFWGVCRGQGENWLGRILMEVRAQLQEPLDL